MQTYYFVVAIDGTVKWYDSDTNVLLATGDEKFDSLDGDFWTRFVDTNGDTFDLNIWNGIGKIPASEGYLYKCTIDYQGYFCGGDDDYDTCELLFETGYIFDEMFDKTYVTWFN